MKRQISFTTDIFSTKHTGNDISNDRCFGEDLAGWLATAASGGEFEFHLPYQIEWGWATDVTAGSEKFVVGCGIMNDSIGDEQADWLITIEKVRRWRMFGHKDSAMRSELCDLIHNVLRDKPHIREIRWTDQVGHFATPKSP